MASRTCTAGRAAAALAALVTALGGCDGGSILPPPAPELNAVSGTGGQAPAALSLALISAPRPTDEGSVWEQTARVESGLSRVIFSLIRPEPGDPPAAQAALIREAAARGTSALVVDAVDDPGVVAALTDARDKGTSVVLIGRPVTDRDPARPLPRVTFAPLDEPAREFLDALAADLRKAGLPADGHALIVLKSGAGPQATETAEFLTPALKSAGFTGVEPFHVDDYEKAVAALGARVAADPKVTTLLGVGDRQLRVAMDVRDALQKGAKRSLSVGGCVTLSKEIEYSGYNGCFGVLDRNQIALARKAVRLAVALSRGEPSSAVETVPITYVKGVPPAEPLTPPAAKPGDVGKK